MVTKKIRRNLSAILKIAPAIVILLALFQYGKPSPPPLPVTISNKHLEVSHEGDSVNIYYRKHDDKRELLNFKFWATWLKYGGTRKRVAGVSNKSWFDDSKNTKVEIEQSNKDRHLLKVSWHNPKKDPRAIQYTFELNKDTSLLSIYLKVDATHPQRLEYVSYGLVYSKQRYDIYTPQGEYLKYPHMDIKVTVHSRHKREIPPAEWNNQLLIDSKDGLTLELNLKHVETVKNEPHRQVSSFFVSKHSEEDGIISFAPLNLTFYPHAEMPKPRLPKLKLIAREIVPAIELYYGSQKLLTFYKWASWLKYNGELKSVQAKKQSWFDNSDSERIVIREANGKYTMNVYWSNVNKDPEAMGYIFILDKDMNTLSITVWARVKNPEGLEYVIYGAHYKEREYDLHIAVEKGCLSFIDNQNNLTLEFNLQHVDKVRNNWRSRASSFYISKYGEQQGVMMFAPVILTFHPQVRYP